MTSQCYSYGKLIKERRVELGLTQRHVADQCGITDSAFAHIERGLRLPSRTVAGLITAALNFESTSRAKFETELREARDIQTRKRVQRLAKPKKPVGKIDLPDADVLAEDLARDPELFTGYRHLRKALSRRDRRKAVLSALKAWASDE